MNSSACWRLPLKAWAMPAAHLDLAQVLEDSVLRAADVQQHRQVELARQFQLFDEEMFLPGLVVVRDEEIQPDLADGDGLVLLQVVAEYVQILLCGIVRVHRVDTVSGGAVRIAYAKLAHCLEIAACHRRDDDAVDTGFCGIAQDVGLSVAEFGGVQVAVGVDEHVSPSSARSCRSCRPPRSCGAPRPPVPAAACARQARPACRHPPALRPVPVSCAGARARRAGASPAG